jgi:hypothetical protein
MADKAVLIHIPEELYIQVKTVAAVKNKRLRDAWVEIITVALEQYKGLPNIDSIVR